MNKKVRLVICATLGLLFLASFYNWYVPWGAKPAAFLFARSKHECQLGKKGDLRAFFNAAGAAHSGNHWCWIVRSVGPCWYVVGEGYVASDCIEKKLNLETRVADDQLQVRLLKNRYNSDGISEIWVSVGKDGAAQ